MATARTEGTARSAANQWQEEIVSACKNELATQVKLGNIEVGDAAEMWHTASCLNHNEKMRCLDNSDWRTHGQNARRDATTIKRNTLQIKAVREVFLQHWPVELPDGQLLVQFLAQPRMNTTTHTVINRAVLGKLRASHTKLGEALGKLQDQHELNENLFEMQTILSDFQEQRRSGTT